jgi:membrane associated rhomboid family serine protease
MNEVRLRTWHRRVGISFVVFVVLQSISGVFLDLSWFITPHDFISRIGVRDPIVLQGVQKEWETMLEIAHATHLGGLLGGAAYRTILGAALLFLSMTGIMIFRAERKRIQPKNRVTNTNHKKAG